MDAEHAAVASRLRALPLDGDTQENLSQIARAVWHSDFGWTQGACRALRDELVRLLGGVSERPYTTSIYDVLGNERHKAVCRLREWEPDEDGMPHRELWEAVMGEKLPTVPLKGDAELDIIMRDRLIHLLGGDQPTAMEYIQCIVREHDRKCLDMELSGAELGQASVEAMSRQADQSHESSPMRQENETTITDELRKWASTKPPYKHGKQLHVIADRIDEQFDRICRQHEAVLQSIVDGAGHRLKDADKKCDELQAKFDETEFAIANWREREKSFDESERLREELRMENDELRERLEKTEEALSENAGKLAMAEARLRDARAKLDVLEENGLTLMHRTLKNMLGEAKSTHDVLRAKVEAMPRFDRERRRLMRIADDSERRCSELLDLLKDAAKEFKTLMEEKGVYANERKA